jgi:ferric-dicitrate binding protein FerR (iron transport regulator)
MTDKPERRPDDETLARWLRDLPRAEADPAFREKLREGFADGSLGKERPASPRRIWVPFAVAAAAAVIILAGLGLLNRGPALQVAAVSGSGTVLAGDAAILTSDLAALNEGLKPGVRVELPGEVTLDLVSPEVATYQVTGGSKISVPGSPGRWFGRAIACSVMVGEVRLATGNRFPGSELRLYTPDGMVVVTGTLLSVQCDSLGTCVCVLEGSALVGVNEQDLEPVTPGNRKIMLRDGTVKIIPVKPMHRDGVLEFAETLKHRPSH